MGISAPKICRLCASFYILQSPTFPIFTKYFWLIVIGVQAQTGAFAADVAICTLYIDDDDDGQLFLISGVEPNETMKSRKPESVQGR